MREAGLAQTGQKILSKAAPFLWWPSYAFARGRLGGNSLGLDMARVTQVGGTLGAVLEAHAQASPAHRKDALARARSVLAGKWAVLGFGIADIPAGEGWHRDCFHDARWPIRYFPFVDYVASTRRCDVKVPWELSRLQFLPFLAEGALLDGELARQYEERACDLLEDWVSANPPGYGVNWTCAMEVAIRAVNILLAFALFASRLNVRRQKLFSRMLADHHAYLQRFPETSDVTGNHYLCDLMGLACLASVSCDEAAFAGAAQAFIAECERQFEADGVHLERAPVYHRLCMDVLCIGAAFIHGRNPSAASRLAPVFERALGFAKSLADSAGRLPVFGDADGGMILHHQADPRSIKPYLEIEQGRSGALLPVWLRGIAGSLDFLRCEVRPVSAAGGFLASRSAETHITMRVGAQGLAGRAPHDHDDATSIWVAVNGEDFIVDRSCRSYTLDPALRAHDLVSSSHNVLRPKDGERYRGREGSIHLTMRGAPVCDLSDVTARPDGGGIRASLRQAWPLSQVARRVEAAAGSFSVIDTCEADVPLALSWHFAPGCEVALAGERRCLVAKGSMSAQVMIEGECVTSMRLFDYDFAPDYGGALPALGLEIGIDPKGRCKITSTFEITTGATQS